jgi:hypothetical protein
VEPVQASEGDTVTITFSVSEALIDAPFVTVNGNEALIVSGGKSVSVR